MAFTRFMSQRVHFHRAFKPVLCEMLQALWEAVKGYRGEIGRYGQLHPGNTVLNKRNQFSAEMLRRFALLLCVHRVYHSADNREPFFFFFPKNTPPWHIGQRSLLVGNIVDVGERKGGCYWNEQDSEQVFKGRGSVPREPLALAEPEAGVTIKLAELHGLLNSLGTLHLKFGNIPDCQRFLIWYKRLQRNDVAPVWQPMEGFLINFKRSVWALHMGRDI